MIISRRNRLSFIRTRSFWVTAVTVFLVNCFSGNSWLAFAQDSEGTTYYTRSTVGKDSNDGTSPATAWLTVNRAASELGPGDTLIIGPGLYRESVSIKRGGLPGRPVRIFGDSSGKMTGDPPGPVVMAGTIPVDETIFEPEGTPGVFKATISTKTVTGAVEMDGLQYRYRSVREPKSDVPYVERVRNEAGSVWYVRDTSTFYIHTRDGKHPSNHELELVAFHSAFNMSGQPHVWISGLTLRHYFDGALVYYDGSDHGRVFNVTAFGSRQGIRVRNSKQMQILKNTLFRNENSGVYFYVESLGGLAQGNISYENDVGIRFGSESHAGLVLDNLIMDNHNAGLSFETVNFAIASHNLLKGNDSQIRLRKTSFFSDNNCYETSTKSGHVLARENPVVNYQDLSKFSKKFGTDLNSREGDCAIEVDKVDVEKLHAETLSYPKRALEILGKDQ
jgi:hypothetical protein